MPTVGIALRLSVRGAAQARRQSELFRTTVAEKINAALQEEIPAAEERIQEAVKSHFNSGEGSGRTARSLSLEIRPGKTGASVRLRMATFPYSKYLTTLLPDSQFKGSPYIISIRNRRWLRFFWKSEGSLVYAKQVRHPGFGRDVIRDAATIELQRLGDIVQLQVADTVASTFARGIRV